MADDLIDGLRIFEESGDTHLASAGRIEEEIGFIEAQLSIQKAHTPEVAGSNPAPAAISFPQFLKKIIVFYFALPFLRLYLTLSCVNFMLNVAQFVYYGVNLMRREDAKTIHYLLLDFAYSFVRNLSSV